MQPSKLQGNRKRIVLIGFRGAGKTTLAQELARQSGWRYISTDAEIEARVGMPIAEFVVREGWERFRREEREVIRSLRESREVIIDAGGGVVEDAHNMADLGDESLVVWVDADPEDLVQRLAQAGDRPLLNQPDLRRDVLHNYHRRRPLYEQYAHLIVNTSRESLEHIARTILEQL